MGVQVRPSDTQVAVLEGRNLIEHYVSRPADDVSQIHGNIYVGKVQNVLPGMEAAFVDIGTPKNAVLYRGDVQYDAEDIVEKGGNAAHRADAEAQAAHHLPGHQEPDRGQGRPPHPGGVAARAVRGADPELERPTASPSGCPTTSASACANILDRVKPAEHGVIVRTAAEGVTAEETARRRDPAARPVEAHRGASRQGPGARRCCTASPTWRCGSSVRSSTPSTAASSSTTSELYEEVRDYVARDQPGARRPRRALRPRASSGCRSSSATTSTSSSTRRSTARCGCRRAARSSSSTPRRSRSSTSTPARTSGTSNLEETVFRNNLEAADEIARQLRLRDIGGIIVIDFIDMEISENRDKVVEAFREALARDKTRTQVFDISELGPGRDDPQAHRRGPARVASPTRAPSARAAAS